MSTFRTAVAVVCAGLVWCSVGSAGIVTTGSVLDSGGYYYVGYDAGGTLSIDAGSGLYREGGYFGYAVNGSGTVTVTGVGSTFDVTAWPGALEVGNRGHGTLTIQSGGQVNYDNGSIARYAGSTGVVTVRGIGSRFHSSGGTYVGRDGNGTLNILSGGLAVTTNSAHVGSSAGSVSTATVRGAGSTWTTSYVTIGNSGHGTLNIEGGAQVDSSNDCWLGYHGGSSGTVTVTGGSTWTTSEAFTVGERGSGTLNVLAGGHVINGDMGRVGMNPGARGVATVSGTGSTWTSEHLYVGGYSGGSGTLIVSDGGLVTARTLSVYNGLSTAELHVGGDDMLVLGNADYSGAVINNGTIRFYAEPFLPDGVYRPISDPLGRDVRLIGSGAYEAFGGAWNAGNKTFEVSATTLLDAGAVDDVSSGERLLFTDAGSGDSVGVSFATVPGGTTFSASLLSPAELADLAAMPEVEGQVLAGWDFTTTLTGTDVLLSLDVGAGMTDLALWHLDGGGWTPYSPGSFTYDASGNASFTASQFSGYAVTGVVPEPASLTLLALGGLTLGGLTLTRRRRKP